MKKMICLVVVVIAAALLLSAAVTAAPSLQITKPPVVSGANPYTGPFHDSTAASGQWFEDVASQGVTVRPYEFHDNIPEAGGGTASTNAIYGKVTAVSFQGPNVAGFTIKATITNDTVSSGSTWADGGNSHGETLHTTQKYVGTLFDTKLTTSFAISGLNNLPSAWVEPYNDLQPYIIAQSHDELAWYCWSPLSGPAPTGGFFVPTYDFGNIPVNQSFTRFLNFGVAGGGLDPTDPRFNAVMDSYYASEGLGDIFMNRTTSLKISDWLDYLALDDSTPYPVTVQRSSDVSVFHAVPEPGSLLALCSGLAGLGVFIRRKR